MHLKILILSVQLTTQCPNPMNLKEITKIDFFRGQQSKTEFYRGKGQNLYLLD